MYGIVVDDGGGEVGGHARGGIHTDSVGDCKYLSDAVVGFRHSKG